VSLHPARPQLLTSGKPAVDLRTPDAHLLAGRHSHLRPGRRPESVMLPLHQCHALRGDPPRGKLRHAAGCKRRSRHSLGRKSGLHPRSRHSWATSAVYDHVGAAVAAAVAWTSTRRGCDRHRGHTGGEKHPGHHTISFRTAKTGRPAHRSNR
jgi:hypothetical protein